MCAGATVWSGVLEANLQKGQTVAIVGIGALGLLGIQFAKALGYRVVAVRSRDIAPILKEAVPQALWPDLTMSSAASESIQQIFDFTDGIGLHAAVVCTDNVANNDWILYRLQPRGTSVVLGLAEEGFISMLSTSPSTKLSLKEGCTPVWRIWQGCLKSLQSRKFGASLPSCP
jgi:D-arabinose 1-dehydrogenase-like Zn-dependent alcohol dehydrogenase